MYADTNIASTTSARSLADRLRLQFARFQAHRRARRDAILLAQMSDHILKDIGLTRGDIRDPGRFRF